MPVIFDAAGAGNRATNASTTSWSHTRSTSGSRHWLFVFVAVSGANTVTFSDASITKSVTYGSTPMIYIGGRDINNATTNAGWLYVFGMQNPDAGTNTVSVSVTRSGYTPSQIMGNSVGYYNGFSLNAALGGAAAAFGGLTTTGAQAPAGTHGIFSFSSSASSIIYTGPTGVANRYNNGASVTGLADYLSIGDTPGDNAGYTITGNDGGNWAAMFLTLNPATENYSKDELTTFDVAGSYSYTIPPWCSSVDVILIGGGEAGTNGTFVGNGSGGQAGSWTVATLQRGVDIPWTTTQITGTVGAGGAPNGQPGNATTASGTGMTTLTGAGGTGQMGTTNPGGQAAGDQAHNGNVYVGGVGQGSLNNTGYAPGGGGAGGGFSSTAGSGARGQVWFYAYGGSTSDFFPMF